MIEKALKGNRPYWIWIISLLSVIAFGISAYAQQMRLGLSVTGLGVDASLGLSFMQYSFMAALSASSVLVMLPFFIHDYKPLGKIAVIAQFLAVSAAATALLFLFVDMGKPHLIFDLLRYATPHSLYSWAFLLLNAFLFINLASSWATLGAERKDVPAATWVKSLNYLSIPFAISIPVVTGLSSTTFPVDSGTLSLLAPRLLLSAFAAGSALLLLIVLILKRTAVVDAGKEVTSQLVLFLVYAGSFNFLFFRYQLFCLHKSGGTHSPPLTSFGDSVDCGIAGTKIDQFHQLACCRRCGSGAGHLDGKKCRPASCANGWNRSLYSHINRTFHHAWSLRFWSASFYHASQGGCFCQSGK